MAIYKGKQLSIIQIGDVPQTNMSTSDGLYDDGRRTLMGRQNLEAAAIHSIPIDEELGVYIMPKRNPYVATPGLDCMLYVAKEGGSIKSILDLDYTTLVTLLGIAFRV